MGSTGTLGRGTGKVEDVWGLREVLELFSRLHFSMNLKLPENLNWKQTKKKVLVLSNTHPEQPDTED